MGNTTQVTPVAGGWMVQPRGGLEPLMFSDRTDAERSAQRLDAAAEQAFEELGGEAAA